MGGTAHYLHLSTG